MTPPAQWGRRPASGCTSRAGRPADTAILAALTTVERGRGLRVGREAARPRARSTATTMCSGSPRVQASKTSRRHTGSLRSGIIQTRTMAPTTRSKSLSKSSAPTMCLVTRRSGVPTICSSAPPAPLRARTVASPTRMTSLRRFIRRGRLAATGAGRFGEHLGGPANFAPHSPERGIAPCVGKEAVPCQAATRVAMGSALSVVAIVALPTRHVLTAAVAL
mmetsp:Transcript_17295/g.39529  ORF Transcript_17295/g.39529 Transcript_17295/m.39529 type:complete len:220 (+) Transcript_17295:585-1244(+)